MEMDKVYHWLIINNVKISHWIFADYLNNSSSGMVNILRGIMFASYGFNKLSEVNTNYRLPHIRLEDDCDDAEDYDEGVREEQIENARIRLRHRDEDDFQPIRIDAPIDDAYAIRFNVDRGPLPLHIGDAPDFYDALQDMLDNRIVRDGDENDGPRAVAANDNLYPF
jgi:hypothetical protein